MSRNEVSGWIAGLVGVAVVLGACGSASGPSGSGPGSPPESPSPLIDVDEIIPGGPPPDGIPPIDHPAFEVSAEVDWLEPQEPVLAIEIGDEARAYPARILIWHEIVNDTVGGLPTTITYCPLCNTGVAFERPTIDGELLDFGTSGKLYRSNLVMYDRQTESLWPQVTARLWWARSPEHSSSSSRSRWCHGGTGGQRTRTGRCSPATRASTATTVPTHT